MLFYHQTGQQTVQFAACMKSRVDGLFGPGDSLPQCYVISFDELMNALCSSYSPPASVYPLIASVRLAGKQAGRPAGTQAFRLGTSSGAYRHLGRFSSRCPSVRCKTD
jgi:hypothetical protein